MLHHGKTPERFHFLPILLLLSVFSGLLAACSDTPPQPQKVEAAFSEPDKFLKMGETLIGGSGHIKNIVLSPDDKIIALTLSTGELWLYDAQTLKPLRQMESRGLHTGVPAWSPDGEYLAANRGRGVYILDTDTGEILAEGPNIWWESTILAWSPDGTRLATHGRDASVVLWDTESWTQILTLDNVLTTIVAWSPDGKWLASGDDSAMVRIWNAATGAEMTALKGHKNSIVSLAWSPDGVQIASGCTQTVKIWDVISSTSLYQLEALKNRPYEITWSPNGVSLAAIENDTIQVWDASTGDEIATLHGHKISSIGWGHHGKRLFSGGESLIVWGAPE